MQYTIAGLSGGEAVQTLEAHVLARAYRAVWRERRGNEPAGPHVIASLDLVIEFRPGAPAGAADSPVTRRRPSRKAS
jgi:hypothetical protein